MIIGLFLLIWIGVVTILTLLTNLSLWFIPLWILIGLLAASLFVLSTFFIGRYLTKMGKVTGRIRHFYVWNIADFVRMFIVRIRIKVIGKENIPKDTNYVVYGNHKSNVDPIIIVSALRTRMGFAAKSELFGVKLLNGWIDNIGCININRENDREAVREILKGIGYVKQGLSMGIFPEGGIKSRDTNYMVDVKPGAYKLATKAGVPIVPIALIGSRYIKDRAPKKSTKVTMVIGKPIYEEEYKEMTTVELGDHVFKIINDMITKHDPNPTNGSYQNK